MSLLTSLLFLTTTGLTLQIDSPQRNVLVGEPVKLVLQWRAREPVQVHVDDPLSYLECWVEGGTGPRRYRERERLVTESIVLPQEMAPGDVVVRSLVLAYGRYDGQSEGFPLRAAGTYALRLVYAGPGGTPRAESNTLSVTVTEPRGVDKEVLELLRGAGDLVWSTKAESLSEKYPHSPYLRLATLARFQKREAALGGHRDPDTGESLWSLSSDDFEALRQQHLRRMAQDLAGADWGPFEEERLELAADFLEEAHESEGAAGLRKELLERFPRSRAAARVREIEAEDGAAPPDDDGETGIRPMPRPSPSPQQ